MSYHNHYALQANFSDLIWSLSAYVNKRPLQNNSLRCHEGARKHNMSAVNLPFVWFTVTITALHGMNALNMLFIIFLESKSTWLKGWRRTFLCHILLCLVCIENIYTHSLSILQLKTDLWQTHCCFMALFTSRGSCETDSALNCMLNHWFNIHIGTA